GLAGGGDAFRQRRQFGVILQRIARGDEQPDCIEVKPLQRLQRDQPMPLVRGVEAAAEQADPHAAKSRRQAGDAGNWTRWKVLQGRVCPLPETRYLKLVSCSMPTGPRACILPVAMPISPPKPNSPPSANCVEALCKRIAESISLKKRATAAASSEMIASVWCEE